MVYLLRHKVKCGYCGQPISAETGTSRTGAKKRYYKCLGRKNHNGCKKSMVRKDYLENLIVSIITELSKPKTFDLIVSGILSVQEEQIKKNSVLKLLLHDKRQTEASIENIMAAIEKVVVTKTTTKRLCELEMMTEELERQIQIEKNKSATRLTKEDIRKYYKEALLLEAQVLINYLIERIVLYDDKIEIHFTKPIRKSPDDDRGFSIYTENINNMDVEIFI